MPELWERQKGETAKAFGAFTAYRNMPASQRSLKAAVPHFYGTASAAKLRQFATWSSKYNWVQRVKAWDEEIDRRARIQLVEDIAAARKRHIKEAQLLQTKAINRLQTMDVNELSPSEVLRYFIEAAKLERTAMGEPESVVEVTWRDKAANAGIDPDSLIREIATHLLRQGSPADS